MGDVVLEMKNITKKFVGVKALDKVNLTVKRGEFHAICGENGAGKSTLMKILNGLYKADGGEIFLDNKKVFIDSPLEAQKSGISIIFQEFNLVETLSVAENIYLGRLHDKAGVINWGNINQKAKELLARICCVIDPKTSISELSVSQKQMVEIAKALSYEANIIVMDEPSATLTDNETQMLFRVIDDLKRKNITVLYISHKMDEVLKLSDTVTVLRDGKSVFTAKNEELTREEIVSAMVGRSVDNEFPLREGKPESVLQMSVKNLTRKNALKNISFDLRKGEILGVAGLVGAGRTEMVRAIFGADPVNNKNIQILGKDVRINTPKSAIRNGIALVNEDRKELGLILKFSVSENISICKLKSVINYGFVNRRAENRIAEECINSLNIKTPSYYQKCIFLSGGNQQKVVLAKWLYADSDILILDEPTRGIDVGSKYEIYNMINQLADSGKSIILISSELPEILGLSDRVIVMHNGSVKGEFNNEEKGSIKPEDIMHKAIG